MLVDSIMPVLVALGELRQAVSHRLMASFAFQQARQVVPRTLVSPSDRLRPL